MLSCIVVNVMSRGGRPNRFEGVQAIELFLARRRGERVKDLADSLGCDPDTISKATREGQSALRSMVLEKGVAWVAGRFDMPTADLMAHL